MPGMTRWSDTTAVNVNGNLLDPDTLPDASTSDPHLIPDRKFEDAAKRADRESSGDLGPAWKFEQITQLATASGWTAGAGFTMGAVTESAIEGDSDGTTGGVNVTVTGPMLGPGDAGYRHMATWVSPVEGGLPYVLGFDNWWPEAWYQSSVSTIEGEVLDASGAVLLTIPRRQINGWNDGSVPVWQTEPIPFVTPANANRVRFRFGMRKSETYHSNVTTFTAAKGIRLLLGGKPAETNYGRYVARATAAGAFVLAANVPVESGEPLTSSVAFTGPEMLDLYLETTLAGGTTERSGWAWGYPDDGSVMYRDVYASALPPGAVSVTVTAESDGPGVILWEPDLVRPMDSSTIAPGSVTADQVSIRLPDLTDVDGDVWAPEDGQALVYNAASGMWVPGTVASGGGDQDSWHLIGKPGEPPYQNGAQLGQAGWDPGYVKDAVGGVHLKGRVNPGNTTGAVVVFTLPEEYRPSFALQYPMTTNTGSVGRLNIAVNGQVSVAASDTWINLGVYYTRLT